MLEKKGTITIKDIAKELQISASTVSRALSDNPVVKPATREAVKALAEKYNYQPNFTALSLRSHKTRTLGIIIPQIVHEFFALVIRGIEDFAYTNGYNIIICSTNENHEREAIDTKALITGRVDGLLVCVSRTTRDFSHFLEAQKRGIPMVFFDCILESIPSFKVVIDDLNAGYVATKHLINQGCQNLAYVGGPYNLEIYKDRFAGFEKAVLEAGLKMNPEHIIHLESGEFEEGRSSFEKLLSPARKIDGLFAGTDMMAIGAIKSMKKAGLKIPDDVAVVGFSNWSISSLYEPSVSTIDQPGYEMGKRAAELLVFQINHPENTHFKVEILQTALIQRESSSRK